LKLRQRAAWSAGDYAVVGTTLQIVGEQLCVFFFEQLAALAPAVRRLELAVSEGAGEKGAAGAQLPEAAAQVLGRFPWLQRLEVAGMRVTAAGAAAAAEARPP
jgi:hypothetical protein